MSQLNTGNVLWGISLAGQLVLFLILLSRRRARSFPWFTLLIGYEAAQNLALILVYRFCRRDTYFWTYWGLTGVDGVLQIGLVFEMARSGLRTREQWVREARAPFFFLATGGTVLAALLTFLLDPKSGFGPHTWPFRLEQFSSLLIFELVCGLLWSANRLGLYWSSWLLGMCRGLAIWQLTTLLVGALQASWSSALRPVLGDRLETGAYVAALVVWGFTFWSEEPKREAIPEEVLKKMARWGGGLGYDDVPRIGTDRKGL